MKPCIRKQFQAVAEDYPGKKWLAHYQAVLPGYRQAFDSAGPGFAECRKALLTYMPEFLPLWEHLLHIVNADEHDARLLSFYCPAPSLGGCSQAAWTRYAPVLVRNYDYAPEYCEGRIMKTRWHDTTVIAATDCLWGVLDGMNEHGLAVSMAFGGQECVTSGFGVPVILRYVLEFCATVDEALKVLNRVPAHMAYNITLLDASGQVRTVELSPSRTPNVTQKPYAVNHQGNFQLSNYAMVSHSNEREQFIISKLGDPLSSIASFVSCFEYGPLFATNYTQNFGTLYTAIYNPELRSVEYRWPNRMRMHQSFACFEEHQFSVSLS